LLKHRQEILSPLNARAHAVQMSNRIVMAGNGLILLS